VVSNFSIFFPKDFSHYPKSQIEKERTTEFFVFFPKDKNQKKKKMNIFPFPLDMQEIQIIPYKLKRS
jgi:hypothetical protein